MQLYIGGYAQGKLAYVQEKLKGQKVPVVNDLHLWVKQLLQEGKPAEEIGRCNIIRSTRIVSLSAMRLATALCRWRSRSGNTGNVSADY